MAYKFETQYNSPNYTPAAQVAAVFGQPRVVKGVTEHWWGLPDTGLTYEGVISWLCRPGGNTSAHTVTDGPTRRVACIVGFENAAWHSGSAIGNATTIGNENNCNTSAKASTTDVSAELLADIRDPAAYGDVLLYGHNDWTPTQCPGHFDMNEIDQLSYKKKPGSNWGEVTDIVVTPPAPVEAEWVRNVKDITDVKLSVLPAEGAPVVDLNTLQVVPNSIIPKGTQVDIAKETTVGGKKFYISSFSATKGMARGILANHLGVPATPPAQEKPEWLKNLVDIADVDMYARSKAPVLNLADGKTIRYLELNDQVRVIKSTTVLGQPLLILNGEVECIEPIYLSDKRISNPSDDLEKRLSTLEAIVKAIEDFLTLIFKSYKR